MRLKISYFFLICLLIFKNNLNEKIKCKVEKIKKNQKTKKGYILVL